MGAMAKLLNHETHSAGTMPIDGCLDGQTAFLASEVRRLTRELGEYKRYLHDAQQRLEKAEAKIKSLRDQWDNLRVTPNEDGELTVRA